jgi:signal peptidase II
MHPVNVKEHKASRRMPVRFRPLLFWGAAAAVLALDQLTKAIVQASLEKGESWPDADWPVRIRYVTNSGAAFGILEDETVFLTVMAFIGIAAIYLYYRFPPFDHWVVPIAIGMLLGGAAGNLLDRVRLGEVTDFIDFPRFPAFNVADSSINIGIAAIAIGYFLLAPRPSSRERSHTPAVDENSGADG